MNEKSTAKPLKSKTNWARLQKKNDEDINYSDIPATSEQFWSDAEIFMPSQKTPISIRLDNDIIDYFKKSGTGYQSKINAVLKAYVKNHPKFAHNQK